MRLTKIVGLILLLSASAAATEIFDLKVTRVRPLRNQAGDLHVDSKGITFRSADGKTVIAIDMQDLRQADVADPQRLRFKTYRVEYSFRAQPNAPVEDIAQFLSRRVLRPVVGYYSETSRYQVPAFHRRLRTGTNGVLEIGEDSIRFVSDKPAHSRTWLYRDIETIGRPDSFRFRVTTNRETYVLELKADLPEAAYQLAWNKIYNLERNSR